MKEDVKTTQIDFTDEPIIYDLTLGETDIDEDDMFIDTVFDDDTVILEFIKINFYYVMDINLFNFKQWLDES